MNLRVSMRSLLFVYSAFVAILLLGMEPRVVFAAPHIALCADTSCANSPALISAPFLLYVNSTDALVDFSTTSVSVENGVVSDVTASFSLTDFTFLVSPLVDGLVSVVIPTGGAHSESGSANIASSVITTTYDATRPVISGMPTSSVLEATSTLGAYGAFTMPTASDENGIASLSCDSATSTLFAIGTTTVVCTATDMAGNVASSTFTMRVVDTVLPVIASHVEVYEVATTTSGMFVSYTVPTVSDDASPTLTPSCTPLSGTHFVLGETQVVCTAVDASGNAASSTSFLVHVSYGTSSSTIALTVATTSTQATGTLTDSLSATIFATSSTVSVVFPSGTTILGTSSWDGVLTLPTITTSYTAPVADSGNVISQTFFAIEVGSASTSLTFDRAARLVFAGYGGASVGWSWNGVFAPISRVCSSDTQETGDALASGTECRINVNGDLVVWTKHFTTFVTYSQATAPAPAPAPAPSSGGGGGGGGSSGGGSSGGGGGGGGGVVGIVAVAPTIPVVIPTPTVSTVDSGEVLGIATFKFTQYLQLRNTGTEVSELQKLLVAQGFLTAEPTGYFGVQTKAAVAAFQKAKGITQTGTVGPQTRAVLNSSSVAKSASPVLGAATFKFTQYLQLRNTGTEVSELQKVLIAQGFLTAEPTGYFGVQTKAAVAAFQKAKGITQTGTVGPQTRAVLNSI